MLGKTQIPLVPSCHVMTRYLAPWAAPGFLSYGAARGQGGGHRGQNKIVVIGLSTEKN